MTPQTLPPQNRPEDLTPMIGMRFGRLTVLRPAPPKQGHARVFVQCDCGSPIREVVVSVLRGGKSRSCRCIAADKARTRTGANNKAFRHGDSRNTKSEYMAWQAMIRRCHTPSAKSYPSYGGRGICVCARWRSSYTDFLSDLGRRPSPIHSLDRYPNQLGNYEPGNVRWATPVEQAENRKTTLFLTCGDETRSCSEWARRLGVHISVIRWRVKQGWPMEKIISTPSRRFA